MFTTRARAASADQAKCPWAEHDAATEVTTVVRPMASSAAGAATREMACYLMQAPPWQPGDSSECARVSVRPYATEDLPDGEPAA